MSIADEPLPQTGAVSREPIPEVTTATPQQQDAESYQLTAGSLRKGLRSGFNQLGSMANAFAGSAADALGLTEFAKSRMADAEEQVRFADTVGPQVKDYRSVKDFDDLVEFVSGMVGQSAATMAPALVGGVAGRAAAGVRGAYAGAAAGAFVPNAGEQALRIKDAPADAATKLGNVLATGVANTALDVAAPGSVVAKAGKKLASEGLLKTVAKTAAVEGITEGAQEAIGQQMHGQVEPNRDSSKDVQDIVDNIVAGAVGGGALGGAGHAVSKAAVALPDVYDSIGSKFKKLKPGQEVSKDHIDEVMDVKKPPIDEFNDEDILNNPDVNTEEEILSAIGEKGRSAVESLGKIWDKVKERPEYQKFKDFVTDDEVRQKFITELKDKYEQSEVKPKVDAGFKDIKDFAKGIKVGINEEIAKRGGEKPKESKIRTAVDHSIYDYVYRNLDEHLQKHLSPTQKLELADYLKHIAMYEHAQRDQIEGPVAPTTSVVEEPARQRTTLADTGTTSFVVKREGDRTTVRRSLPAGVLQYFGDRSHEVLNGINNILTKADMAKKVDFGPIVKAHQQVDQRRDNRFAQVVKGALRDEVAANPEARDHAAELMVPVLLNYALHPDRRPRVADVPVTPGSTKGKQPVGGPFIKNEKKANRAYQARMDAVLDEMLSPEGRERVMEYMDAYRKRMTVSPDTVDHNIIDHIDLEDLQNVEVPNEQAEGGFRQATPEDFQGRKTEGDYGDQRIGVPSDLGTVQRWHKELTAPDSEYDTRRFTFEVQQTEDGRYEIAAKDRGAEDQISPKEWENLREPETHGKSGLGNGVITVRVEKTNEKGQKQTVENKMNMVRLTAWAMRTTPREDTGGVDYLYDMVSRGLGRLLGDPNVKGLGSQQTKNVLQGKQHWDMPDNTLVAFWRDKYWTWGEVKDRAKISSDELAMRKLLTDSVEKAQDADSISEIEHDHLPEVQDRLAYVRAELSDLRNRMEQKATKAAQDNPRKPYRPEWKDVNQRDKLSGWVARLRRAEDAIYEEIDRREKHADAPRSDIRGLVEDERLRGTTAAETPTGPRFVESDTGVDLRGAQKSGPIGALNTGLKEGEKRSGQVIRYINDHRKAQEANMAGTADHTQNGVIRVNMVQARKDKHGFPNTLHYVAYLVQREKNLLAGMKEAEAAEKALDYVRNTDITRATLMPKSGLHPQTPSQVQGKQSLVDNQKQALIRRIEESDDKSWSDFLQKVRKSDNEQALKDTMEFIQEVERGNIKNTSRLDKLEDFVDHRLLDFEDRRHLESKKLDPSKVADNTPVWAVTEYTDNLTDGKVLAVFKDMSDAQGYAEKVGGNTENNLMGKLRDRLVKPSTQNVGLVGEVSDHDQQMVIQHIDKILGPEVAVKFVKNMKSAGSFIKDENGVETIRIHLHALDAMGVGRHEAAHALMSRLMKADQKTAQVLQAAAGSPTVVARLRKLLAEHPAALEQLKDAEERVAYMYQMWASGLLNVGPNTQDVFDQAKGFFRKLAGIWSETFNQVDNVNKAEKIFALFESGELAEPSTMVDVLRKHFPQTPFEAATKLWPEATQFFSKAFYTAEGRVRDLNIPAFDDIMDKFHTAVGSQDKPLGNLQTRYVVQNKFQNQFKDVYDGTTEAEQAEALDVMRGIKTSTDQRVNQLVTGVRQLMDDVFEYLKEKKVNVVEWDPKAADERGVVGKGAYVERPINYVKDYLPRFYDRQNIFENQEAFLKTLTTPNKKYGFTKPLRLDEAEEVLEKLLHRSKRDPQENDAVAGLTYFAPNTQERSLQIPDAVLQPFLIQDLLGTVFSYLSYTTRRGEYASRFGNQGQVIKAAEITARQQGATTQDLTTFNQAVMAMEGSLGHDINPTLKKINGAVITYQNYRLLPLALFTSLVDPIGIAVRGGGMKEAFNAFTRGLRNIVDENKDDAYHLAKVVGSISTATDAHMLADSYGTQYLSDWQKKANNFFFKWNGMERWNRSMRVAATAAAERFIIRHVTAPNEHSERYLHELGLTPEDVQIKGGSLVLNDKVQDAIVQWVDGAILRPNSAYRPVWMSDPHWMIVAHLKQFTYTFQKTIVARVVHEMENGNYTPAYALLAQVPLLMASDIIRATFTPGGHDDQNLERLNLFSLLWRGLQRAGLFGPGQYALDAWSDLGHDKIPVRSLAGPTVQQLYDFGVAAAGRSSLTTELAKAVPGYSLVR